MGRSLSPEHREKISAALKGRPKSAEHRVNLSAAQQGKKRDSYSPAARARMSEGHLGVKLSDETKAKIADTQRRRWSEGKYQAGVKHSLEARVKIATYQKNRSPEHKQKLSAAMYRRWQQGMMTEGSNWWRRGRRADLGDQFFRSSWEANYARILNLLGVVWEFESRRLVTPYGSYCPDFYLPESNTYVEIKGWEQGGVQKCKRDWLQEQGIRLVVLRGQSYARLKRSYSARISEWE